MDPISQGVLGAVAAQNAVPPKQLAKHIAVATLFGIVAGMAPDLDTLITSDTDPLLFLHYHRQFTHSLIFIPIGGLLCALLLHTLVGRWGQLTFRQSALYCTIGYATHALLDSCTSYGTQLFWPFSDTRVAWSNVSIVDPLFTLPLLALVLLAVTRKRAVYSRMALIWVVAYLGVGVLQKERAEQAGLELAQSRNHVPVRLEAKPSFGNSLVWKVIYETGETYYVDAIRVGLSQKIYPGTSIAKLNLSRDFPGLNPQSQQAADIARFRWFSDGFLALSPNNPSRIIDARYSMLPNEVQGLWMIEIDPDAPAHDHVAYRSEHQDGRSKAQRLWQMIRGQ